MLEHRRIGIAPTVVLIDISADQSRLAFIKRPNWASNGAASRGLQRILFDFQDVVSV